jgi:transmembrane sensor
MNFEAIATYLAGESSPQEKQEIEHWRQANSLHEQDFQRWKHLWEASQTTVENFTPDIATAWQKVEPVEEMQAKSLPDSPSAHGKQYYLSIWIRNIAAVLILAAGLGWEIWKPNKPSIEWVETTSLEVSKQEVMLADGTKIWLNAQSRLRYPKQFTSAAREVFLEGEAYFEVAENAEKPFLIHTQGAVTEVIGTTFTIRSFQAEPMVEVNLLSGKVSFRLEEDQPDQQAILKPGQRAILEKASRLITVSSTMNQNLLAWKTGKLIFQDAALRDALQTLEAYYRVDFTVSDSLLLNCRFTGSFDNSALEDVLKVFAFGSDISYQKLGNQYVLSGKGCNY